MRGLVLEAMMICGEKTLEDLLSDPVIGLVMESDRVRPVEVRVLFERVSAVRPASFAPPSHTRCEGPAQLSL